MKPGNFFGEGKRSTASLPGDPRFAALVMKRIPAVMS
jgi:hypothetical protein